MTKSLQRILKLILAICPNHLKVYYITPVYFMMKQQQLQNFFYNWSHFFCENENTSYGTSCGIATASGIKTSGIGTGDLKSH